MEHLLEPIVRPLDGVVHYRDPIPHLDPML